MLRLKATSAFVLLCACAIARADLGSIQLTSFPDLAVADSRSTLTITATVRQNSGRLAPDGTRVTFQTTLGHFQQSAVTTINGYARAVLVTSGTAGTAKITASAIALTASATTEVEFVASRSELESANSYIEIDAPRVLRYMADIQLVKASGSDHSVRVQFGKTTVETDDMQFNVSTQELRAKRAKVTYKGHTHEFRDLNVSIPSHRFVGTTSYSGPTVTVLQQGRAIVPIVRNQTHFGVVQLMASGDLRPLKSDDPAVSFDIDDTSQEVSMITAQRAVVFPNKEIQFQHAQVTANGLHVMSVALYRYDLNAGQGVLGEQVLTVNNNRLGVNYPYYLSLNPNNTSLFRFTTGQTYGNSFTGNSAALINYEMTWSHADGSEGGLNLTGINRADWSLDAHHSFRFEDGSSLTALASSPQRRSLFGSIGYNKPLNGFQLTINENMNRSLVGPKTSNNSINGVLESDPHRVGFLPLTIYYGLTATSSMTRFESTSQHVQNEGVRLRGQFDSFRLDKATNLSTSFSVGQQWGTQNGLAVLGTAGLSRSMPWGSFNLNYEYTGDNTLATQLSGGRQRLSLETDYHLGRTDMSLLASKSLDADWSSLYGDLSYRVNDRYRLAASYSLDKYLSDKSLDYNVLFAYRLGLREVGLVWSRSTNRIGFEILGSRF